MHNKSETNKGEGRRQNVNAFFGVKCFICK